jgi:hypothetical protein
MSHHCRKPWNNKRLGHPRLNRCTLAHSAREGEWRAWTYLVPDNASRLTERRRSWSLRRLALIVTSRRSRYAIVLPKLCGGIQSYFMESPGDVGHRSLLYQEQGRVITGAPLRRFGGRCAHSATGTACCDAILLESRTLSARGRFRKIQAGWSWPIAIGPGCRLVLLR